MQNNHMQYYSSIFNQPHMSLLVAFHIVLYNRLHNESCLIQVLKQTLSSQHMHMYRNDQSGWPSCTYFMLEFVVDHVHKIIQIHNQPKTFHKHMQYAYMNFSVNSTVSDYINKIENIITSVYISFFWLQQEQYEHRLTQQVQYNYLSNK